MRYLKKVYEIIKNTVISVDGIVVGDIIAIVAQGRRKERHKPNCVYSQILKIIQFLRQSPEVPNAVAGRVIKGAHMDLIYDGILVPEQILRQCQSFFSSPFADSQTK